MSQQPSIPVHVLVVDDDAMSRELLTILLEGEGYTVDAAESGEGALARLRDHSQAPAVILTDMQMPGITGGQLAAKLRRACGPSTLLFAMSGSQPPAGSTAEFDAFLLKPFKVQQITDLLSTLSPAVDNSQPHAASKELMPNHLQEAIPTEDVTPVLNETIYQQLAGTIPAPQLHEMYTMCLDDARERIDLMRSLITSRDNTRFVREAHSIKGSCGMLGATQLHGMAAELEKNGLETAGAQEKQEVNSLDELSAACDRLERMLGSRV